IARDAAAYGQRVSRGEPPPRRLRPRRRGGDGDGRRGGRLHRLPARVDGRRAEARRRARGSPRSGRREADRRRAGRRWPSGVRRAESRRRPPRIIRLPQTRGRSARASRARTGQRTGTPGAPMIERTIRVTVNGRTYERTVEVRKTLADFLRDDLELTGT